MSFDIFDVFWHIWRILTYFDIFDVSWHILTYLLWCFVHILTYLMSFDIFDVFWHIWRILAYFDVFWHIWCLFTFDIFWWILTYFDIICHAPNLQYMLLILSGDENVQFNLPLKLVKLKWGYEAVKTALVVQVVVHCSGEADEGHTDGKTFDWNLGWDFLT